MTIEKHAITTSVSMSVTKLHGYNIHIMATPSSVYVYPANTDVSVTCGKLEYDRVIDVSTAGAVVKMENAVSCSSGWMAITYWSVLYQFYLPGLAPHAQSAIQYDPSSGMFFTNFPCWAAIRIEPFIAKYAHYKYTPDVQLSYFSSASSGLIRVPRVTYGTAYAWHDFGGNLAPPVLQTQDIPAPVYEDPSNNNLYETYKITTPTILTDQGEWAKPKDWDSDNYNKENAYGSGNPGPDKDSSWVKKQVTLEVGRITGTGDTKYSQNTYPSVLGLDKMDPKDITYVIHPSDMDSVVERAGIKPDDVDSVKRYMSILVNSRKEAYKAVDPNPNNRAGSGTA